MLNYNKLFDVIYSETLSEDVKCRILEKVSKRIDESELYTLNESELNPMTSFVVSLIESDISEEALNEVLDMTFENVNEDVINEVSDELRKRAAQEVLPRRRTEAAMAEVRERENKAKRVNPEDPTPVGLAGLRRESAIKQSTEDRIKTNKRLQHAENVAGSKSALSGLKDTVGKIFKGKDKPIGIAKPLGWKASSAPKKAPTMAKPTSSTSPQSAPKAEATDKSFKFQKAKERAEKGAHIGTGSTIIPESPGSRKREEARAKQGKHLESGPTIEVAPKKTEVKNPVETAASPEKKVKKAKESKKNVKDNSQQLSLGLDSTNETPKNATPKNASKKATKKETASVNETPKKTKKTAKKEVEASETAKTKKASKEPTKETEKNPYPDGTVAHFEFIRDHATTDEQRDEAEKRISNLLASDKSSTEKAKGLKDKKKGLRKSTNEALSEFIRALVNSNISEGTFTGILEMISNKQAADKAVDREYERFNKKADMLNKAEETKAQTGVDPLSDKQREKISKEVEKAGNRYETFRRLANNKYNLNK